MSGDSVERLGRLHGPHDGPGHHVRAQGTDSAEVASLVARGEGKECVAVEHGCGPNGKGIAVPRELCQLVDLFFAEVGVGRDYPDGGVGEGPCCECQAAFQRFRGN